jgi:hypothetical protein
MYTEDEKKVGKALLKKEADQIRGQVDYVLDGVRNAAYSERMAAYNTNAFKSTVESFMAKAPKNFVIPVGKSGAKDLGEFPFEVNDEVQARVAKTMQNPASFAERFKNEDGAFDMDRFYNFLVHLESQDNIYKSMANFYHSKGWMKLKIHCTITPILLMSVENLPIKEIRLLLNKRKKQRSLTRNK